MGAMKTDSAPLRSPVDVENRALMQQSTAAFLTTAALIPVWLATVVPLSLIYQLGWNAWNLLRRRPERPKLDSGYVFDQKTVVPRPQRDYDIVLLGATGFCGVLAVRHMAKTYGVGKKVKWAIAGRSKSKMEALKTKLAVELDMDELRNLDTLVADNLIPTTLAKVIERSRAVASTVGPYALYGSHVVELCAKVGTHYVDITGESCWVQKMASLWQATALESGAILVPFCGHDSIPWDMTAWKLSEMLHEKYDDELESVQCWNQVNTAAPGGTFATVLNMVYDDEFRKMEDNPFLRKADGSRSNHTVNANLPVLISPATSPWHDSSSRRWEAPYAMAYVNAEVIEWSRALRSEGLESLTYRESYILPDFKSAFVAHMGLVMLGSLLLNPLTSSFLRRFVIPKSGEGPSMEDMEQKNYLCVLGEGIGVKGNKVESIMYFPKDPGCLETSRMLVEAGLCLALEEDRLPARYKSGFLTPSTALGNVLMKRLVNTGTQFSYRAVEASTDS